MVDFLHFNEQGNRQHELAELLQTLLSMEEVTDPRQGRRTQADQVQLTCAGASLP